MDILWTIISQSPIVVKGETVTMLARWLNNFTSKLII